VDGVVVAGAAYSALLGTVFDAVLGGGARADGNLVTCTGATDLASSLIATGFSDSADQRARQGRAIAELLPDVGNLRRIGPATMDLCAVAAGHLDAFFEMDLEPWECAAGLLIAAEAGARTGTVPTPHGEVVVAAAPGVYEQLVAELQRLYD
jgi:myo-inositol-1(or 4)-monophosphatase